ncbi:MAG TPA: DUF4252 domain-containing protein [Chryseosolibacter sp.]|nr:DUF4252 domain-containing protein [Chryseosolibacter sp.]
MKKIIAVIILLTIVLQAKAQSDSYSTIKAKFKGEEDVVSFGASGLLARTVLWIAGEHDFKDAIQDVRGFKFITIPKKAFANEKVSVNGMRKLIADDNFEELTRVKDHGDDVSVYLQKDRKKNSRYLVVIEENTEVVVLEIVGNIDLHKLKAASHTAYNK